MIVAKDDVSLHRFACGRFVLAYLRQGGMTSDLTLLSIHALF